VSIAQHRKKKTALQLHEPEKSSSMIASRNIDVVLSCPTPRVRQRRFGHLRDHWPPRRRGLSDKPTDLSPRGERLNS
jgi:hypothetical protein